MKIVIALIATFFAASAETHLTVREALDLTAKQNPDVQLARLRILEAEARAAQTKAAYMPQATFQIGGAYQTNNLQGIGLIFPGIPGRIGPYSTFNARPTVTQTIVDLSLLSNIRAARQKTGIARHDADTVREDALLAVLQLYLQALQADSRVEAATARQVTAEAVLAQAQDRERQGTASQLDIARAREQVESERGLRIAAARDSEVLKTLLVKTIGLDEAPGSGTSAGSKSTAGSQPAAGLQITARGASVDAATLILEKPTAQSAMASPAEATKSAYESRSELRSLEARTELARLEVQAATRQRFPRLSGSGDFGVLGASPDRSVSTYSVGASLSVPIWTGRRIESEIAAAKVHSEIVTQEIRKQKLAIHQELQQSYVEWQAATNSEAAATAQASAARETLELARLRFQNGLATSVDTQVAQSALAQADDLRIRAGYDRLLAAARLARAKGDVLSFAR